MSSCRGSQQKKKAMKMIKKRFLQNDKIYWFYEEEEILTE